MFNPDPDWYAALRKSSVHPPPAVFQVAWTMLYVLLAISAWTMWSRCPTTFSATPYLVQLAFNALWIWVFFHRRHLTASVGVLVLNLVVAVWSLSRIYACCPPAAPWLIPNLFWLSFALYLNEVVWWKN